MSIRELVGKCLNSLKSGEIFDGNWLHDRVAQMNDAYTHTYPDTILRIARMYYRDLFKVYKRSKSQYIKL